MGFNGPVALDYGAVVAFAGLTGLSPEAADLLQTCLPDVEAEILAGVRKEPD